MIDILVTDVFADWYAGLDEADAENVTVDVDLLEHQA